MGDMHHLKSPNFKKRIQTCDVISLADFDIVRKLLHLVDSWHPLALWKQPFAFENDWWIRWTRHLNSLTSSKISVLFSPRFKDSRPCILQWADIHMLCMGCRRYDMVFWWDSWMQYHVGLISWWIAIGDDMIWLCASLNCSLMSCSSRIYECIELFCIGLMLRDEHLITTKSYDQNYLKSSES